jgi:outer membrane receptor protein involved in Fe transport
VCTSRVPRSRSRPVDAKDLLVGGYCRLFGACRNGDRVEVEQGDNAFSADVGYTIAKLTLDVSGYFRQRVALLPQQGSYLVLNSRVSYRFRDRVRMSATSENLLNERAIGLTSYNLPNAAPARGRTFYLLLSYE